MKKETIIGFLVILLLVAGGWLFKRDKIIEYLDTKGIKIIDPDQKAADIIAKEDKQPDISLNPDAKKLKIEQPDVSSPDWWNNPINNPSGGVVGGMIPNNSNLQNSKPETLDINPVHEYKVTPTVDNSLKPSPIPDPIFDKPVITDTSIGKGQVFIDQTAELSQTIGASVVVPESRKTEIILKIFALSGNGKTRAMNIEEATDINNINAGRPLEYFQHFLT